MIHFPLNKSLEINVKSSGEKEHLRNIIIEQLKAFVVNIMNNRELLQKKSAGAISRIRTEHDPVLFQQRLNAIYRGEITES